MFKHILLPTDLTERDRKAMDIAIKMARQNSAKITLLHVVETIADTESEDFQKFYKQLGSRAAKQLDKIIEAGRSEEVSMEKQVLYGKRVYEIITFANNRDVDLIIMSSHRLDPDNTSEGWGTISFKVGVLSHCPVMLVK